MSLPRKSAKSGTRGYAHLVEIHAPIARVWRALTDPALIRIWSGLEAEVDPRKYGIYRVGGRGNGGREAHIDIFEENRRLRLIYTAGAAMPAADSAVVDDFLLDQRKSDGTTSLRVLGSGIPESRDWDQTYARIRIGWERYLARIKVALESPPKPKKPAPVKKVDPPLRGLDY